jgi:hypothetical protein
MVGSLLHDRAQAGSVKYLTRTATEAPKIEDR